MAVPTPPERPLSWFVMRDLKRANAKQPAYKMLTEAGFEVFTPMRTRVVTKGGKQVREEVPFIQDLLFVHSDRETLDETVMRTETLQYRYLKGHAYCTPMTVSEADMNRFIAAVSTVSTPRFFHIDEITPGMYGSTIKMICEGTLNGIEGRLLKLKGSGKKRLVVELPGLLAAAVEISTADYIELL